ncbi:MAG: hypothetical protein [phage Lak_Megaphage_RVC_AP4_GC26]|uniref:Peptidase S74 domain-containing protein n=1 Tax=phage Lak_Megaphage_RVC_AP3_GC26 TaxID=3109225 RepID=A0ABZ0Z2P8_9CAUD|nr:MAG: hypothetical protein [phage Lak_Megaphage_RVC_AP3_GC26]WQJ52369.1 MAG: hypothetical protein [phage Lak_Megaphage_RVC_AP4_GC26]
MIRTPLLRPLRDNGATLYVFPSANEDIGLNLNSRATGVAMSHYALLNLPVMFGNTDPKAESIAIATDLQNYMMNLECTLLNQDSYNYQEYHTVSERAFFHWLKSFEKRYNNSKLSLERTQNGNDVYYKETDNTNRVVQCFGAIDAGNSLSTEFGMFNETYVNIPTSYGNGPVFFKQVQDSSETNYIYGKTYNTGDSEHLQGRKNNVDTLKILSDVKPKYDNGTSYKLDDAYEIVKDINEIQSACRVFTNDKNIQINSYDDVNIDQKTQFSGKYCDITLNPCEFGFNAILLYYSVYDQNDTTKTAYAINLFGIVFLDSPSSVQNGQAKIPSLIKKKSFGGANKANFFGNSYSFRVNIKTLSVYDNTDAMIQDNTTMSSINSVDFSDVVSNLNRAIDVMNTNVQSTMAIQDAYMTTLKLTDENKQKLQELETKLDGYLNGSKTSGIVSQNIRTKIIQPITDTSIDSSVSDGNNMIKIQLNKQLTDFINTEEYQGSTYTPPIKILNDEYTYNVPTVYKPIFNVSTQADTALGEWSSDTGDINDIINGINVNYYTYNNNVYPSIELPQYILQGFGFDKLVYRTGDPNNDNEKDTTFLNYESLIPLMIKYIQDLNERIKKLESKNNG